MSQHRWKGNNIANFNKEDFTYDSYGNLLTKTTTPYGSAGRTVSFTYDATKRFMTGSTDVEGLTSTAVYNAVTGKPLSQTNPFNQTVSFAYDAWGRLTTTTDIYGKQTTVTYTKNSTNYNYTIAGSAQSGAATEQEFDPLKRLIRESYKDALGQWVNVKTEYDAMGRPWRKSEPYTGTTPSQWTATEYDVYSRPVKVILPTGKVTNMNYSGLSVTVNDGTKTTVTTKNAIGLVTTQQDPGGSVNYTYYSNGAMKTADYGGSTQTLEQDGWGRKTKLTDPSAGVYVYQYNAWDELTGENSPKGSTAYQYDAKGKLTQKTVTGDASTGDVPTSMVTVYAYDATTKLPTGVTFTNADGNNSTTTFSYDSYKRVSQTVEENPKARFTKTFGYDAFGRTGTETQTALNKSNNKTATQNLSYTYQNNVLKKITTTDAGAIWELTGLNARGQVTAATLGSGGLQQQNTYDNYGLPTGEKLVKQGTELFNYGYTWNVQRGLLTGRSTTLFTNAGQALTESFQYDALDRLTQWSNPATGAALTQSYDTRGRISSNGAIGTYTYAIGTTYLQKDVTLNTAGQAYYSGHELQQAVYNNFKQPVTVTEPGKDKITFQYGAGGERAHMQWGRTYSSGSWGSARYQRHYSADGTMEITEDAQTSTTTFIFYTGGDAYSAPAIRRSVQSGSSTNEMLYLHRDHLGSIIAITDGNGVIKEKRHFDAWGNLAKLQNGSGTTLGSFTITDRGYTGHEHLTVGLVHMNGRLYDPALHRFLMPDNYVQDTYNTQNFNRYAYVLNNPLRYTDPSGELTEAQWNEALDMMSNILNSTGGGGGHIGGDMASPVYFSSQDVGLGYGIGYMDTFNGWGSQPGWAGSPEEALNRYNGGNITAGMVEGYYTQQWAGTGRENISASYSVKGGFNVGYNFNPGMGNGTGVGNVFVSDGKMAGLLGLEYTQSSGRMTFPAFSTLWSNYPQDVDGVHAHPSVDPYPNQCAIRVGDAFIKSGIDMSSYPQVNKTSDGYPRSSKGLADWTWQNFGKPKIMSVEAFQKNYSGQTGLIFENANPGYTSHIDLWNAGATGSGFYTVSYKEIWFWPIK
ncbi:MAG: T6SS effector amidase Tae4 family protein [Agriterribacter sp.]